jgi:hypothetical protein
MMAVPGARGAWIPLPVAGNLNLIPPSSDLDGCPLQLLDKLLIKAGLQPF